jgi:ATP-dependent protease ClpP protease subunit
MNLSDLQNDYLLNEQRIMWLAEDIDEPVMERIAAQLWYLRKKDETLPIRMYFRCDGGDSRTGLAIANIVKDIGRVCGVLVGDTGSSAATIWAACEHRWVYANARLGIHPVTWQENYSKYDASKLRNLQGEFTKIDERQCEIYAAASHKSFEWWWERYNQTGDVKWLDARELICIGMAEKAEDWK